MTTKTKKQDEKTSMRDRINAVNLKGGSTLEKFFSPEELAAFIESSTEMEFIEYEEDLKHLKFYNHDVDKVYLVGMYWDMAKFFVFLHNCGYDNGNWAGVNKIRNGVKAILNLA